MKVETASPVRRSPGAHSLSNGVVVAHADDESDWGGMWSDHYAAVLANSSYALCPGGAAPYASERLVDAIRAGAAPVVVDDGLLVFPFAGLEDADALWARCAVVATPDLMRYGSRGLLRRLDDERDAGLLPARLEACRSLRTASGDGRRRRRGLPRARGPVDAGRDRVRSKPTYRENERDLVDGLRCLRSNAGPGDRLRELALTVAVAEEFILVAAPRLAANEYDVATRLHEELEKNASVAVPPWASRAAGWSHYVLGMLDEQDGLVLDARDHYDAADRLGVARASRHGIPIRDLLAAEPVLLGVETRSWLLKEMATGWRLCGAVACGVSLGDPFEGDHATVYLTTHASNGFPVDFPYVDRPRHANAVVFMEHDARFFPDGGFEKSLEAFRGEADVTLGFAPGAPLAGVPHLPLSYVTDPPGAFATPPVDFDRKAKHVLWVSSQCDPKFARDRLERVDALRAALGPLFASHGACRPTATMEATFPECASLPTDARSGGAATVDDDPRRRCAYRKSAFVAARVAAYENSAAPGYATERLFQVLAEGSVPVYWGAPDARALLPAPAAAVMAHVAAYLAHALANRTVYDFHLHWRSLPPNLWAPGFRRALDHAKPSVFCAACAFAAATRRKYAAPEPSPTPDAELDDLMSWRPARSPGSVFKEEDFNSSRCARVRPGGKIIHEPAPIFLYRRYNESRHWRDLEVLTPAAEERVVSPVRTATLGALLDGAAAPPIIDHLHVDTAGSEAEVLRGFPHHARCARRVSVSAAAAPKSQRRVHVFLEAHGYVVEGTDRGCDVFYGDCGAFAPSEGAPLLALKSPRPGDERGQSVKVALSADLTAAPEVRRDPDAYDVCFDCGFGKSCHGLRGGLVLPRCDARELGDGLGRVDATTAACASTWASRTSTSAAARREFSAAAALGEPGAAARLAALLERGAAAPRSACAAEAPRACASRSTAGPWTSEGDGVDVRRADLALAMGLVDSVLVLHDASVPPLPAILAKFEARFGRDRVVGVAAGDVDGVLARDGATHFYVQKAGLDDGLVSAVARTLVHCVFFATQAHGDVYARVSDHVPVDGPASAPKSPASAAAVVPLVVRPGDVDGPDLREELGIAANATVFGRHGGLHTFSIDFVKAVVEARAAARPDVVFLFMNTAPFGAPIPNVRFIPGTADPDRVAAFVRTCDAMLHARAEGETFGLAVADFARHDRPVLTFDSPDPSYARFHLSVLQRRAIPYRDARSLEKALDAFDRDAARRLPRGYWNAYHPAFGPAAVMDAFERVFLADGPGETFRRPPPANDGRPPAAAAYLAAG
ncbi:hypothetical protein JL720_6522 [Aureococcus anophagefferens]|nr:hypothetical protein JL720_6522 [Aureococcus anophagefferens]